MDKLSSAGSETEKELNYTSKSTPYFFEIVKKVQPANSYISNRYSITSSDRFSLQSAFARSDSHMKNSLTVRGWKPRIGNQGPQVTIGYDLSLAGSVPLVVENSTVSGELNTRYWSLNITGFSVDNNP